MWFCIVGLFARHELLVVLAVVAILAALMLPALGMGKVSANRIRCASNLRQLGLASHLYWDDHDGCAFRYRGIYTNGGDIYWFGWLQRGSEGERAFDPTCGALYPYLVGVGVEICPALNYRASYFKLKAKGAAYGYGYNTNLSTGPTQPPLLMSQVPAPSEYPPQDTASYGAIPLTPSPRETPAKEELRLAIHPLTQLLRPLIIPHSGPDPASSSSGAVRR